MTLIHQMRLPGKPAFLLPQPLRATLRHLHIRPSASILIVSVNDQRMRWLRAARYGCANHSLSEYYYLQQSLVISTSRFGVGQDENSDRTPLGLHRIAERIGAGHPIGTVFRSRKPVGLTWDGMPEATIAHRIMWLDGLEPGYNQGAGVDSFRRYIYIHGVGDEMTLGRPASHGCIHLSANDLMPMFDCLPVGTLAWIISGPLV